MSADPNCLKAHPTLLPEDILAGANGGLANVIVYVSTVWETARFSRRRSL